jgi:PhnB protein
MAFHPYLNFPGTAREAFTRYQEIFGGELFLMGAGDMPAGEGAPAAEPGGADLIVHAALQFDGQPLLMASDAQPGEPFGPVQGMYVNYGTADVEDARRVFEALAEGGTVEMPFGPVFFSPGYGTCVDRFGTPWMVSTDHAPES